MSDSKGERSKYMTLYSNEKLIVYLCRYCLTGLCGDAEGDASDEWINKQKRNCRRLHKNKREWCYGNSWRFGRPTKPER